MDEKRGFWMDAPLLRKGAAVLAVPILVMVASAVGGIWFVREHAKARNAVIHTLNVRREASGAAQEATVAWAEREAWTLARDEKNLGEMRNAIALVERRMARIGRLVSDNAEQSARVREASAILAAWHAQEGVLPEPGDADSAREDASRVREIIEDIYGTEQQLLLERLDRQENVGNAAVGLLAAGLAFGVLGSVVALLAFSRGIVGRVDRVGAFADSRAEGKHSGNGHAFGRDEIGRLALRFAQAADRIQAGEENLGRVRERLRLIVDQMTSSLIVKDAAGRCVLANKAYETLAGAPFEQMEGRKCTEFYPPEMREQLERSDRIVRETGVPTVEELSLRTPDGERILHVTRFLLPVSEGGGAELCAIGTDITGRVQAERELARSRARLQAIVDNMTSGLFIKDRTGKYLFANKAFMRMVGRDDIAGLGVRDFVPEGQAARVDEADRQLLASGIPEIREHQMSLPTGEGTFQAARFLVPWEDGDCVCAMITDVTERVRAMAELRRTRDELETRVVERTAQLAAEVEEREAANGKLVAHLARMKLLNQIAKAIAGRHDISSLFQIVLAHLRDHLGIDLGIMLYFEEKSDLLVVGARTESPDHAGVLPELRPGSVSMLGTNGLRSCVSGRTIHMPDVSHATQGVIGELAKAGMGSAVASPLRAGEETLGVLLAVRRDKDSFNSGDTEYLTHLGEHVAIAISQLKLMDELQRAYTDLRHTQETMAQQERLRAMGQMASGIAHDINNALGPIAIYCEMMANDPALPPDTRRQVRTILKASEGIARTVENLRHFYRPAEGGGKASPVRINDLVRSVVELTRPRWKDIPQQSGVTIDLRTELGGDDPEFPGFEGEVRNALTNLIFNSVDAMPSGGTIHVRTLERVDAVMLEVADTGIGMDERTKARCFEPFFTTKGESGTGLGLPMVFGIVKRHGGTIEIESAPGRGATFRLSFPSKAPVGEPLRGDQPDVLAVNRTLRILTVDDDPMIRESLTALLLSDAHKVRAAENGPQAIEACETAAAEGWAFDVVITDLGMPGMDGRELAIKLKARWPSMPIILLTGWGSHLMDQAERMGEFVAVLAKPPRATEVRSALLRACP